MGHTLLGLDTLIPRFSWAHPPATIAGQAQQSYELAVNEWTTGRVVSNASRFVALPSTAMLTYDTSYAWRVRWWDDASTTALPSPWLEAMFSTGLGETGVPNYSHATIAASNGGWAGAQWMQNAGIPHHPAGNQLRRTFALNSTTGAGSTVKSAFLYVAANNVYWQISLDGVRISDHVLGDATQWEQLGWYRTFNVTSIFRNATTTSSSRSSSMQNHVLAATHGGQWVRGPVQKEMKVRLSVTYNDGSAKESLISDRAWHGKKGPVSARNIYAGQSYNANFESLGWDSTVFNETVDGGWINAMLGKPLHNQSNPKTPPISATILASHVSFPPIRLVGAPVRAVEFWQAGPSSWVYDFGVNRAAVTTLTIPAAAVAAMGDGTTVTQQSAEALLCAKPCFPRLGVESSNHGATNTLTYVVKNGSSSPLSWTPKFAQIAGRYWLLNITTSAAAGAAAGARAFTPTIDTLAMRVMHTDVKRAGDINFGYHEGGGDTNILNAIHDATVASQLANWMSIPTDCPQRDERLGWMGDAWTSHGGSLLNHDLAGSYLAWLRQISVVQENTSQNKSDSRVRLGQVGGVPDCVPFYGGHCHLPSSPSWGAALPGISRSLFRHTADVEVAKTMYPVVRAYALSMKARANTTDTVNHTMLNVGGWGDWCPPTGKPNITENIDYRGLASLHQASSSGVKNNGNGNGNGYLQENFQYIDAIRVVLEFAHALDTDGAGSQYAADITAFEALEAKVVANFHDVYRPSGKGAFNDGQRGSAQTYNALAIQTIGRAFEGNVSGAAEALAAVSSYCSLHMVPVPLSTFKVLSSEPVLEAVSSLVLSFAHTHTRVCCLPASLPASRPAS